MYATDRYTFLKKVRFGRKGRIYRVMGFEYESDIEEKKFVEIFRFRRGDSIDSCSWEAKFVRNPEAAMWDFDKVDIKKLQKELRHTADSLQQARQLAAAAVDSGRGQIGPLYPKASEDAAGLVEIEAIARFR